jgi:hypothetical protein
MKIPVIVIPGMAFFSTACQTPDEKSNNQMILSRNPSGKTIEGKTRFGLLTVMPTNIMSFFVPFFKILNLPSSPKFNITVTASLHGRDFLIWRVIEFVV